MPDAYIESTENSRRDACLNLSCVATIEDVHWLG
jgi:hypothetical protein